MIVHKRELDSGIGGVDTEYGSTEIDIVATDAFNDTLDMSRGWWKETQRMIDRGYERVKAKYGWRDSTYHERVYAQIRSDVEERKAIKRSYQRPNAVADPSPESALSDAGREGNWKCGATTPSNAQTPVASD